MESKSAKDSFIMRHNWIENMRELSGEDFKEMILAIHEFAQDGKVPEFKGFKMLAWKEYQAKLQDDKDKYFEICERNKANGSLGGEFGKFGGRPRKTPNGDMKTPNGDMKTPNGDMKTPKNPERGYENPEKPRKTPDNDNDYDYDLKEKNTDSVPKEKADAVSFDTSSSEKKSFGKWSHDDFQKEVDSVIAVNPEFLEYRDDFISYWTESSKTGKMRFQCEKCWETLRRLRTWKKNDKSKFNPEPERQTVSSIPTVDKPEEGSDKTAAELADRLWNLYPLKTGIVPAKLAAKRAYEAELDKGRSPEEAEELLVNAVSEYAEAVRKWAKDDRKFIWTMKTFFDAGHQFDDPETWQRKGEEKVDTREIPLDWSAYGEAFQIEDF